MSRLWGKGTALACLPEALGIYSQVPSGYNRHLQFVKAPLFRDAYRRVAAEMANEAGERKS